ncbi:hypothetical protein [Micromonospora sp. SH-82]|uniref:hypothetical protein n=1 Tax=Micromonospora sp. SH-82 TaxID=3132938 RepID=UPI003EC0BE07
MILAHSRPIHDQQLILRSDVSGMIWIMTNHHSTSQNLVYGHAQMHDCLAFADGNTAAEEAAEIRAIAAARTWGEARRIQTTHVTNPADPENYNPEEDPADEEPFDINELGSVVEGDWPPMVAERAVTLLPEELRTRFGDQQATVLNGDLLEIPLSSETELVAELRRRGYQVHRDDELINVLDGRSFSPLAD